MANIAATKLLTSLFAGQSPSDVETSNLELILKLMAQTGGNDSLTGPAEVVRRATALVGRTLAVQRLEYLLQTQADKEARS